jgi:hypothetical protein
MSSQPPSAWPDDEDGQVLRRLDEKSFDFTQRYVIDFVVDFDSWPPEPQALNEIRKLFPVATEYVDDVSGQGSITVKVEAILTYQLVVDTQSQLTRIAQQFGGWCDSWGVLH